LLALRAPEIAEDPLAARMHAARKAYRYVVLYSGNYGWGHDLGVVWEYLRRQPEQRLFFFLFVGGGEKWAELERVRRELPGGCLMTAPYVARERMPALIRAADFGLVALERSCVGLMSPSKIHGYLLCGKPLLYVGPAGSNVAEAITAFGCGLRVEQDDLAGWLSCVQAIGGADFDYAALSARAARAAAARYTERVGVRDLITFLGTVRDFRP
jgi:hypothetical protein